MSFLHSYNITNFNILNMAELLHVYGLAGNNNNQNCINLFGISSKRNIGPSMTLFIQNKPDFWWSKKRETDFFYCWNVLMSSWCVSHRLFSHSFYSNLNVTNNPTQQWNSYYVSTIRPIHKLPEGTSSKTFDI